MKASILAVGTELTTGQIINKNAATISEKLKAFGVVTACHLTVPDDKQVMLDSMRFIENHADLIFITGGLGPTSDDFTRDVVSEWSGLGMIFDAATWDYIQKRLTERGFIVRDMQKQQCYFPAGAQILTNSEGTAHAFKLSVRGKSVYVLPGPPREIEAVWKAHIDDDLQQRTQHLNKLVTRSWDTIGTGESEVAHQVEEILKSRPSAFSEIGYRVHLPYVEVKFTHNQSDAELFAPYVKKIDDALAKICVGRDFFDVVKATAAKIKDTDFTFYDFVSDGFLHSRLSPKFRELQNWSFKQSRETPAVDMFENEDNFLALLPFEEDQCILLCSLDGKRRQKILTAPMKSSLMSERRRQYFSEMALVEFLHFDDGLTKLK